MGPILLLLLYVLSCLHFPGVRAFNAEHSSLRFRAFGLLRSINNNQYRNAHPKWRMPKRNHIRKASLQISATRASSTSASSDSSSLLFRWRETVSRAARTVRLRGIDAIRTIRSKVSIVVSNGIGAIHQQVRLISTILRRYLGRSSLRISRDGSSVPVPSAGAVEVADPLDHEASFAAAQRYAESRIREFDAASARSQAVLSQELDFLRLSVRHLLGRADWAEMSKEDAVKLLKTLDIDSAGIQQAMRMFYQLPLASAGDLKALPGLYVYLWSVFFLNSRLIFSTCWSPAFKASTGSHEELKTLVSDMVARLGDRSDLSELSVIRAKELLSAFDNIENPITSKYPQDATPTAFKVPRPLNATKEREILAFVANHASAIAVWQPRRVQGSPLSFLRISEAQASKAISAFFDLKIPGAATASMWEDIASVPVAVDLLSACLYLHSDPITLLSLGKNMMCANVEDVVSSLHVAVQALQRQRDASQLSRTDIEVNDTFRRRGLDLIDRLVSSM